MTDLPGPKALPLVGNLLQLHLKRLHQNLEQWAGVYGSIYTFRLVRRPVVVVSDPKLINQALRDRPTGYRRLASIESVLDEMGIGGVFSAEGDRWHRQRRMTVQALNTGHLHQFFITLIKVTEKLLKRLEKYADSGQAVDVQADLTRFTVDVTTNLAFGYDVNTLETEGDVIQQHLEKIFPMVSRRVNAPFPYWRFFRLPADRALDQALAAVHDAIAGFISHCHERMIECPDLVKNPTNLLEAMLAAKDDTKSGFSVEEITGNVLTMLLGGEDTTANTMAWMIYFMTEYPQVQKRMQQEADDILQHTGTLSTYTDHERLKYIEAVALETMRLKSVVPLLFLETNRCLELGNIQLPSNTAVFLLIRQCGLWEQSFGNPDDFNPERWLNNFDRTGLAHDPNAFLPFGAGPRFCPGRNLALLEIKTALVMMCRNFSFSKPLKSTPVDEQFAFVMTPTELSVNIRRRNEV